MNSSSNNCRFIGFLVALLTAWTLLLASGSVMAGSVKWEALSNTEQSVLKAFQGEWGSLPDKTQSALRRWAAKPAAERAKIKQRFGDWKRLSQSQQQNVVKQLKRYRAMSAEQKARIRQWHEWVKKLPEAERKKLREQWSGMNDAERRAYMKALQGKYGKR
ncbi:DUF3106 domain-containing protein [Thiothrix litoralis]|jgi:flagellar motility protein MotE (MotC chaperone)|uniref:DUF3106 domain-containing protein n=1 Tax=Thiothrix litoralis TaxID=2891210 RepID=A0ABX7WW47_9GAMM|nr:DUF3106 domain-containing protein [Thiothrix litoralis]QTR47526.1 DUF3106 domain-containing protein [Thiothrix litoralis]